MALARDRLRAAAVPEAEADARLLVEAATGLAPIDILTSPGAEVAPDQIALLLDLLERRGAGEPVGRILGRRDFWGMTFRLSPATLEPRPDSETLVIAALEHLGPRRSEPLRIADLGTGTGCLLAALLTECPNATGLGVDLSAEAAKTARINLAKNGLAARAEVIEGSWDAAAGGFDLVVSNPPYIPAREIDGLAREVRDHDPRLALDGGADGLDAYRAILTLVPSQLNAGGAAALEVGLGQAADVTAIATSAGLGRAALRRDLAGHERALVFVRA
jgi:release factor glutamine methyltransferase